MKTREFITVLFITAVLAIGTVHAKTPYSRGADFYYFYDQLESYGSWIELNDGLLVWRPYKSFSWQPYRRGSWIWTDAGWYWDSYEPFGNIVYHYGRWFYDDYYGWLWVPDYEWAPAWVSWRYDDEYIGWAPLPPYAVFSRSRGLSFTISFSFSYHHWHFVRYRNFCDPDMYNYYVPYSRKHSVFGRTRYRDDYRYDGGRVVNQGIGRDEVERRSGVTLRERKLVLNGNTNGRDEIRKSDTRIEVFTPDTERRERGKRDVVIERGLKATEMDGGKVTIGERRRNLDDNRARIDDSRTAGERGRVTGTNNDDTPVIRREDVREEGRGLKEDTNERRTDDGTSRRGSLHGDGTRNYNEQRDATPKVDDRRRVTQNETRRDPVVRENRDDNGSRSGRERGNTSVDNGRGEKTDRSDGRRRNGGER